MDNTHLLSDFITYNLNNQLDSAVLLYTEVLDQIVSNTPSNLSAFANETVAKALITVDSFTEASIYIRKAADECYAINANEAYVRLFSISQLLDSLQQKNDFDQTIAKKRLLGLLKKFLGGDESDPVSYLELLQIFNYTNVELNLDSAWSCYLQLQVGMKDSTDEIYLVEAGELMAEYLWSTGQIDSFVPLLKSIEPFHYEGADSARFARLYHVLTWFVERFDNERQTSYMVDSTAERYLIHHFIYDTTFYELLNANALQFDQSTDLSLVKKVSEVSKKLDFESLEFENRIAIALNKLNLVTKARENAILTQKASRSRQATLLLLTVLTIVALLYDNYRIRRNARSLALENAHIQKVQQLEAGLLKYEVEFATSANKIIEEERLKVAMDLHDGVSNALTGLNLFLTDLSRDAGANKELDRATKTALPVLKNVIEEVRFVIQSIGVGTSLHDTFDNSLKKYFEVFGQSGKVNIRYVNNAITDLVSSDLQYNLFRLIQELVSNAVKYGDATVIDVKITHVVNGFELIFRNDRGPLALNAKDSGFGHETTKNRLRVLNATCFNEVATLTNYSLVIFFPES